MAASASLPPIGGQGRLSGLRNGFRAMRIRNYRLYYAGQLVSLIGTWMQTTVQSWLVLQLSHSPAALGLVTTLQFLPITILSLFGGVIADKLPKRRLLIGTQAVALTVAAVFGLLVALHLIQLWHIYILAALTGLTNAFDNPARQSFTVELVGREDLTNAVALNSTLFNAARIVGPAVGGFTMHLFGAAPALFFNAASFFAGIGALVLMNPHELHAPKPSANGNVLGKLKDGLQYTWRTPSVLLVMLIMAAIGTFGYNFSVILPLIADFVLRTDAAGFGTLLALSGVGSLIAAVALAFVQRPTARRLLISSVIFSFLLIGVGRSHVYLLTGSLLILLGMASISFATTANTLVQLSVRDDMRGRVMGLYMLLFAGTTPIGALMIGALARLWGVENTVTFCALCCLVGVAGAFVYERRHHGEVDLEPEEQPAA